MIPSSPFNTRTPFLGVVAGGLLAATATVAAATDVPVYKDPTRTVAERVEDLLGRMTLEEKAGQITQADHSFIKKDEDVAKYNLGSVLSGGDSDTKDNSARSWADLYDRYQKRALSTRLGIPLIYGIDAVHGHNNVRGAVIFPHNIGLGATRNPELVEKISRATAVEVAATGIRWTFAPCIAVVRDERWGRTYEGFGESTELATMMAAPAVRGLQGDDLTAKTSVLACAKHFAGDGGTSGGVDRGDTVLDDATFRKIHVEGYKAAIKAGVGSVMASFNSVNGKKVHGQKDLIHGILKGDLGFKGFVVSDWAAINELGDPYSNDVTNSINAGIDMIMVPDDYVKFYTTLLDVVKQERITQARIDDAVRRILTAKFQLGLFENPMADRSLLSQVGAPEHRALAREAVRESLVLLKNENKVLPLAKEARIVVTGSGADDMGRQCGGWTITWQGKPGPITDGTSILTGLRNASSCTANVTSLRKGKGALPKDAQIGVIVISEKPYAEGKGDRPSLDIDPEDIAAVQRIHDAGLRTVVVVLSGRPLILQPILSLADAVVAAWLPGTEGAGVADVLYGDAKFTGKLSHSWPASMDQVPVNVDKLGPDSGATPLYSYGFGLSY
jgi:beta-glucosidase